jgi:predicted molibdopterin-dependent oxidoreductase YjgC
MNADLSEDNLIMEMKIKEAQKSGAKLVLVNSSEIKLTKFADLWVDSRKGTNTILMNGVIQKMIEQNKQDETFIKSSVEGFNELKKTTEIFKKQEVCERTEIDSEIYDDFTDLLTDPEKNIVFIYNLDSRKEKSTNDLKAICNYLLISNRLSTDYNGLILLRDYSNSAGQLDMGIDPDHLPGQVKIFEKEAIKEIEKKWNTDLEKVFIPTNLKEDLTNGKIKAALIFGEDPFSSPETAQWFNKMEYILAADSFETETMKKAEVILSMPDFIEEKGSYTNCEGRLQEKQPILDRKRSLKGWEIITKLGQQLDNQFDYQSINDVFDEMCDVNRIYHQKEYGTLITYPAKKGLFHTRSQKAKLVDTGSDVKTISPSKPTFSYSEMFFRQEIKGKLIY